MTNQPGLKMLLEKIKAQVDAFQQALMGQKHSTPHPLSQQSRGVEVLPQENDLPLEIGNELLITDDIAKVYSNLSNARGRVVIIDQIPSNGNRTIKASAFGIQVDVDMKTARYMRAAYLFREQV